MNVLDITLVASYKSVSQKVRVMSEAWVEVNLSCPFCRGELVSYLANKVGYDFQCKSCKENFQLKSFSRKMRGKIIGGEYRKTIEKFQNGMQPNLLVLIYEPKDWRILNILLVHRKHLSESLISPRAPLSSSAIRAGWQGCSWILKDIPKHHWVRLI